eukprot:3503080-Rhodomonas_salina.1
MASGNGDGAVHYMWDDNPEAAQLQQQFGVDSQGRTVHNFPGVPAEALIEGPHASMAMFSLQLLLGCMWFMKTLCSPDQHFTDAGIMQEELPGYDPEEVLAKPHRELTFQECEITDENPWLPKFIRYGLPMGTVIMATREEAALG